MKKIRRKSEPGLWKLVSQWKTLTSYVKVPSYVNNFNNFIFYVRVMDSCGLIRWILKKFLIVHGVFDTIPSGDPKSKHTHKWLIPDIQIYFFLYKPSLFKK
ncbi:MAG TPA: hypothetical protein DCQ58_00655 [Saprospirales bacterium]|nr:hypothetical protein [Saprospirales bacterium]